MTTWMTLENNKLESRTVVTGDLGIRAEIRDWEKLVKGYKLSVI